MSNDTYLLVDELRQYAEDGDLSSRDLAARVGVGKSTINRWFNGEVEPKGRNLQKLIEFLEDLSYEENL